MKLTDATVRKLAIPAGKSEAIFFDAALPGFAVRLRASGSSTWIYQYRFGEKQRRLTIGPISAKTAAAARAIADQWHAKLRLGTDPAKQIAEARANASRPVRTFAAAMEEYLARKTGRPRSLAQTNLHLRQHGMPLHKLELAAIDLETIATELRRISNTGGPVTANRARSALSHFFTWCCREGWITSNPVALSNKNPEQARDRVLSPAELRAVWRAAPYGDYGDIVRLLMLTACRREEIAGLRWSEIDFERDVISFPAARMKGKREHMLPMSAPVRALLETRPRLEGRDFVFGRRAGGFSGWGKCKQALDAALPADVMQGPWVVHDLRRSVATLMHESPEDGGLGVQPHIVEAVLAHASGVKSGVCGVYNRAAYLAEKRQALTLWADFLLAVVEGRAKKVVPFARPETVAEVA